MKIIAFEGIDKSGKATVSRAVEEYLTRSGYKVCYLSFPDYQSKEGQKIKQYLTGEIELDAEEFEQLQFKDKYRNGVKVIEKVKDEVDFVIIDRFAATQIAYGLYNLTTNKGYKESKTLYILISLILDLPLVDRTYLLETSPKISMMRKGEHGENDKYESNLDLLEKVSEYYPKACKLTTKHPQEDIVVINTDGKTLEEEVEAVLTDLDDYILSKGV